MKICSVALCNFRCFDDKPITIRLSEEVTAFVGTNGSGKTAALEALTRVFGITREQRTVRAADFRIPPGESLDTHPERQLYIEICLSFPELADSRTSPSTAVPATFRHMIVDDPAGTPRCRLRLDAKWRDDGTAEGSVEQDLSWIGADGSLEPISPNDRNLVQVHYIPASRHASELTSYATDIMASRLTKAIAWSKSGQNAIELSAEKIRSAYEGEHAIETISEAIKKRWTELHDITIDAEPHLSLIDSKFAEIVRRFRFVFEPSEQNSQHDLGELSDGLKSLFYFSLSAAVFDIEDQLAKGSLPSVKSLGFAKGKLQIPALTVFALEEPENHLSPFYLARIIKQIQSIGDSPAGQAILTSHSPSILGRIEPSAIRHFQLVPKSRNAIVNEVRIPDNPADAAKYVREAVIAYPELYFARFVILTEGDSEQIVLLRLASAMGLDVDPAFVAIVPLGGRHVNHFWRLLSTLGIPYATLLDLDFAREGGGWGRIKYACEQLSAIGTSPKKIAEHLSEKEKPHIVDHGKFAVLHTRKNVSALEEWISALEKQHVFFSVPLDLDYAMLSRFRAAYKSIIPSEYGPRIPSGPKEKEYLEIAAQVVLGENCQDGAMYKRNGTALFPWYRYLFLNKSKPTTHLLALSKLDDQTLKEKAPQALKRLLRSVDNKLKRSAL